MLIGLCSAKGSPGVTTAALALGARWPSPDPTVVEADPAGGDLAARFRLDASPSLVTLAAACRHTTDPQVLHDHCQRLPGGLRVVAGPIAARQAHAALSLLASHGGRVFRAPGTVLLDVGRVDASSQAVPLLRSLDGLLVLAHPNGAELAHVATLAADIASWTRRPGLVLVGPGYPRTEVEAELRIPVLGTLPDDPRGARVLCGASHGPGPQKSGLGRAAAQLARRVLEHLTRSATTEVARTAAAMSPKGAMTP